MDQRSKEYHIANITPEDLSAITELEHKLKERTKKDIVIIAYQADHSISK